MKILELDLRAFGPFTNVKLNLADGLEGMHILYGPNEAGKSSALRALRCMLYGIPKNSADNFLHDNKTLRIGGRLQNSDGVELAFLRRKGNKDTLLSPDEKPIDERMMDRFLHGMTGEIFGLLFGIDHDTLVRGGRNILEGKGETGQSLFAAGAGGANLRTILETIDADAEVLFKNRGQLPVINKNIGRHQELRKKISELTQSSREWAEKEKELGRVMAELEIIRKAQERDTAEMNRLRRLKEIVPRAGLRKDLLTKMEAMGEVTILPEDFTGKRHRAENKLNAALEVKHQAELDLERLNEDIRRIVLPQKILDQADAVEGLHRRLGQHTKAAEDLGKLQGRLQQNKTDIHVLLLELKPDLDVEAARNLRPKAAVKTRIQKLASLHASLQSELLRTAKDLRDTDRKLNRLKDDLKILETPKEPGPLKKTLAKLAKSGDLSSALRDAQKALRNEEEKIRNLLQRLPLWSRPIEGLGKAPVPSSETVSRFEDAFSGCKATDDNLEGRLSDARAGLQKIVQQIDAIQISGAVPTEVDLGKARDRRQQGWGLVRKAWIQGENVENESRAYDPEHDLAEAYEVSVAQADDTADRLRREAARVAEYAALLVQEKKTTEEIIKLEADRHKAKQSLAQSNEEWKALWTPAGIEPLTPKEMRSWLEQYGRILQRLEKLDEQKALINKLHEQIAGHREALIRRLEELGERGSIPNEAFGPLVERCEAVLDKLEKLVRHRVDLETKISTLSDDIKDYVQAKIDAEHRHETWQTEWSEAVKTIGLSEKTTPDEAILTLSKLEDLFNKIDDCDTLEQRIFGIFRDADVFHADVKALIGHAAPDWSNLTPDQAVVQLNAELTRARKAAARHAQLAEEIEQKRRGLGDAKKEITLAKEILDGLCRRAGCTNSDELESREKLSADYQDLRRQIRSREADIVERGGGAALEEILQQIETVDIDVLTAQIEDLESRLGELKERKDEIHEKVGSLRSELGRIDGSGAAAEAAEEAQGVLAIIRDHVDEYVKLRLSSLVLRHAIEKYRAKHQGPLLEMAGRLFSRLTLGSFSGLRTDYGENDEPILQGLRPDGKALDVVGMSDGTLDQLYLSLRLATLEKYLETNEPMPFIVDDILIRFDDNRSRSTLEVLADLSKKTQVLFFTHHERLVEIAKTLKPGDGVFIHRMG